MKVLLATEAYWPIIDGGSDFERRLVKGLRSRGHDVRVIAPSPRLHDVLDESDGYPIYRPAALPALIVGSYRFSPLPGSLVKRIIEDFAPDVIHVHNPYGIGRAALKYGRRLGIPVMATNHLMPENFTHNIRVRHLRRFLDNFLWRVLVHFHNRSDAVTSPSATAVKLLVNHGLRTPSFPVSNGVDLDRFRPGQDASALKKKLALPDKPIVLYTGRLDREKRIDVWIDAIPTVREKVDAHFVIVGRGNDLARAKSQVEALGLTEFVTFPGFLEDEEFPLVYNLADVFAISSPAELQSIVTLEALASGLPIVAVNVGALPELCHESENGYLVAPDDPKAFGQAVARVLGQETRSELGLASRELALAHDQQKTHERYLELYRGLIEGKLA